MISPASLPEARIKAQSTLLQAKGSMNRVERIAEREVDGGVLRVQLKCHTLRRRSDAGNCKKCDRQPGTYRTHTFDEIPGPVSFIGLGSEQPPAQGEPVEREVKRRQTSYMQSQQSSKNLRMPAKNPESTLLKPGTAVERKHQSRH